MAAPGEPARAGSTCDHCGTAIADVFNFRSADGRTFHVGSTCVEKSGDAGLKRVIAADVAKHRREVAATRAQRLLDDALARLPDLRDAFAAQPHPNPPTWAGAPTRTRLDWIDWMLANAGRKGRTAVAKYILAYAAGEASP